MIHHPAARGVDTPGAADCRIAWKGKDGSAHSASPLGREQTEMLVEVYRQLYPDESYWVQSIPATPEEIYRGGVSRPRRRNRSDKGH